MDVIYLFKTYISLLLNYFLWCRFSDSGLYQPGNTGVI